MSSGMTTANDPFASFIPAPATSSEINDASNRIHELEIRLDNIQHESNDLQAKCNDLQRQCMEKEMEISRLQELIHNISTASTESATINESLITSHQAQPLNVSPFEMQSSSIDVGSDANTVPYGDHGQQIEDLQRNVSDLEKYVTDLEHKLKAANEENAKHHVERANLSTKTKHYEDQIAAQHTELETLKNQLTALKQLADQQKQHSSQEQLPSTASLFGPPTANPFVDIGHTAQGQDDAEYAGRVPVVEETIVPKKAYLCYPDGQQQQQSDSNVFTMSAGESDGWGDSSWGNEAILEEQHQSSQLLQSNAPSVLNRAAVNLQVEIDQLKTERDTMSNDLSALQKLLKKLREYKAKIDEHEHSKPQPQSSSAGFNDLDLAIQEELNSQVKALEQRVKELKTEQEKDAQEKKKLLSRIDVLTAANERMIELKDKQDVEIEVCKTKIRDLTGKLGKLSEWDAGDVSGSKSGNQNELVARLTEAQNHNRQLEERITRMQAAVNDKDDFEEEREQYFEQIRILTAEKVLLEENILIKDNEIGTLVEKLKALEDQNNDYRATIEVLSVESNNIKMHLDQLKDEHKQKINENTNLSEKMKELMDRNAELAKQVDEMRVYNLNADDVEQRIQDLNASIQYKDLEIMALNEKSNQQTNELKKLSDEFEYNSNTILEYKQKIAKLTSEKEALEELTKIEENDNSNADQVIQKLEAIVQELREEKAQMETELQVLNDQVMKNLEIEDRIKSTVLELDMKNIEISELKNSLQQMNQSQPMNVAPSQSSQEEITALQRQLQEKDSVHQSSVDLLNAQWQQVVDQRCAELADSWRNHLQIKEDEFNQIENELRSQLEQQSVTNTTTPEKTQNSSKFSEMSSESRQQSFEQKSEDVDTDQTELIKTMQAALESQEIEIVSLKEQLAIRSAEYARIVASVDPYGMKSSSSTSSQVEETTPKGNKLDLALYMLHQRDMRCEELTAEVIHLLEERDTLQLKFSNSIRQLEEFKRHEVTEQVEASSSSSPVKPVLNTTSEIASSHDSKEHSQSDNLDLKLSELHKVNHSRDKTLYEEREQRRRQMNLFERDVANMPPEAIAELFGPDFNPNTRNNQNPSSMILNWLWGKPPANEPQN